VRCEIIGVGTELLLGQIVNTNAAWIGQRLADVGWDCLRHTVVGDNTERIAGTIREALGRADAVILTGGLGASPSWMRGCASGSAAWASSAWPR
jgi:nicotinamide-nucleotide amidase